MRTFVIGLVIVGAATAFAEETPARARLRLEVELPTKVESGQPFELSSTFTNPGGEALSFFVPEHVRSDKFPLFVFTDEEGQRWRPYDEPYGSEWTIGLHGEVIPLAPGARKAFEYRVMKFVKIQDPNSQKWNSPVPLRAGTYTVTAVYEQKTNELTYGVNRGPDAPFASEKRVHAGLWTGKVSSKPVRLEVTPPRTTTLTIDSPYELYPGAPFELRLELRNGSDKPFVFDGAIEVTGASKAHGSGTATIRPPGYEKGKPMTLAPGAVLEWKVDIGKLDFEPGPRVRKRNAEPAPLADILQRQGIFLLVARIGERGQTPHVTSNELWRMRKRMW